MARVQSIYRTSKLIRWGSVSYPVAAESSTEMCEKFTCEWARAKMAKYDYVKQSARGNTAAGTATAAIAYHFEPLRIKRRIDIIVA